MALAIKKTDQPYYAAKAKPKKNGPYLAWLHTLPSCISGRYGVEAAHVSFANPHYGHWGRGKGTKAPDLFALPLTQDEHAQQHGGSEEAFWARQGINPHELCVILWAIYSAHDEAEATARATAKINAVLAVAGRLRERELS